MPTEIKQPLILQDFVYQLYTLQIKQSINNLFIKQPQSYCYLAFFSFLRVNKFTISSDTNYDKECHLSLADVSVDDCNNPQLLRVKIKQSKTDPFQRGVDLVQLVQHYAHKSHTTLSSLETQSLQRPTVHI